LAALSIATLAACNNDDNSSNGSVPADGSVDTGAGLVDAGAEGSPDATAPADARPDALNPGDASVDGMGLVEASPTDAGPGDATHEAGSGTEPDAGVLDGAQDAVADAGSPDSGVPDSVIAEPGYAVSVWATGTSAYFNPDPIDTDGTHVWVAYQNMTTTDGSDGGPGYGTTSTIVEYSMDGKTVLATYSVPGHSDGMRVNPTTHKVWVSSNEDADARLFEIDPTVADASAAVTEYTVTGLTHGGGIDDLQFVNGNFYVACSNPANPGTHVPAVGTFTISNSTATFNPVFYDDSSAVPVGSDAAATPLHLSDPDSFAIDTQGRLVLISQADDQLITLTPVGDAGAVSLTVLTAPTQLEDTVWITATTGQLLLVDATANTIYSIKTTFTPGTVYTETPDDSTIPGVLATLDPTMGTFLPKVIGFGKPTGLLYLP
jgi:hypothetical protein